MRKFKKLIVVISSILCMVILFSSSVFAEDEKSSDKTRMGTPQEWQDLKNEILSEQQSSNKQINTFATTSGSYPSSKGDILVTSTTFSWQDTKSWVGHAGIVYNYENTLEAFPNRSQTVQFHANDWANRYANQEVYGLNVPSATTSEKNSAVTYCNSRCYSGKCYWLTADKDNDTWVNCASLVWHAYYKNCGTSISNVPNGIVISPISLVDSEKTTIFYTNF